MSEGPLWFDVETERWMHGTEPVTDHVLARAVQERPEELKAALHAAINRKVHELIDEHAKRNAGLSVGRDGES